MKTKAKRAKKTTFKIHPRVFAALGADLVTNDVVAIIELVKNSYDAYATRVDIRFGQDSSGERWLEVEDNGSGMAEKTIKNVWCVVATPYRQKHQYGVKGNKRRRVSGEKGLGRLATARLGKQMEVETKWGNHVGGLVWTGKNLPGRRVSEATQFPLHARPRP